MTSQKPFHVRECAVQEIGGIRNAQLGILLKHKQAVQVPFQAEIRASESGMGVAGLAGFGVLCAFVEEVLMPFKPCFQGLLSKSALRLFFKVSANYHSSLPASVFGLRVK